MTLLTNWRSPGSVADPYRPQPEPAETATPEPAARAASEPAADAAPEPAAAPLLSPVDLTPPTAGGPRSRSARREARRREQSVRRRRVLRRAALVGAGVGAAVALIVAASSVLGGSDPAAPSSAAGGRTQATLFLQVTDGTGAASGTVLLARSTESDDAVGLLIPSRVIFDAPGAGSVTMADAGRLPDPAQAGAAVADRLGVVVDGSLRLDPAAFAALIDAVGGVTVSPERDVTDGSGTLLAAGGTSTTLDGARAVRFASVLADGERDESRAARFGSVLTAMLAADPAELGAALSARGASATQVEAVTALAEAVRADGLSLSTLPVTAIDTGSSTTTYRVDREAAEETVAARFAGARPAAGAAERVRVLVQNGVGTPGLGQVARDRLLAANLDYVNGGNARSFGRDESAVVISSAAQRSTGVTVAAALGLPPSAVRVSDGGQTVADVVVVLGRDFAAAGPGAATG